MRDSKRPQQHTMFGAKMEQTHGLGAGARTTSQPEMEALIVFDASHDLVFVKSNYKFRSKIIKYSLMVGLMSSPSTSNYSSSTNHDDLHHRHHHYNDDSITRPHSHHHQRRRRDHLDQCQDDSPDYRNVIMLLLTPYAASLRLHSASSHHNEARQHQDEGGRHGFALDTPPIECLQECQVAYCEQYEYIFIYLCQLRRVDGHSMRMIQKRIDVFARMSLLLFGPAMNSMKRSSKQTIVLRKMFDSWFHHHNDAMFLIEALEPLIISEPIQQTSYRAMQSFLIAVRQSDAANSDEIHTQALLFSDTKLITRSSCRNSQTINHDDMLMILILLSLFNENHNKPLSIGHDDDDDYEHLDHQQQTAESDDDHDDQHDDDATSQDGATNSVNERSYQANCDCCDSCDCCAAPAAAGLKYKQQQQQRHTNNTNKWRDRPRFTKRVDPLSQSEPSILATSHQSETCHHHHPHLIHNSHPRNHHHNTNNSHTHEDLWRRPTGETCSYTSTTTVTRPLGSIDSPEGLARKRFGRSLALSASTSGLGSESCLLEPAALIGHHNGHHQHHNHRSVHEEVEEPRGEYPSVCLTNTMASNSMLFRGATQQQIKRHHTTNATDKGYEADYDAESDQTESGDYDLGQGPDGGAPDIGPGGATIVYGGQHGRHRPPNHSRHDKRHLDHHSGRHDGVASAHSGGVRPPLHSDHHTGHYRAESSTVQAPSAPQNAQTNQHHLGQHHQVGETPLSEAHAAKIGPDVTYCSDYVRVANTSEIVHRASSTLSQSRSQLNRGPMSRCQEIGLDPAGARGQSKSRPNPSASGKATTRHRAHSYSKRSAASFHNEFLIFLSTSGSREQRVRVPHMIRFIPLTSGLTIVLISEANTCPKPTNSTDTSQAISKLSSKHIRNTIMSSDIEVKNCHESANLSVEYFRSILNQKTLKLTQLCNHWSKVSMLAEEGDEQINGAIRSTVGQAKLLMSQRFKQFSDLIDHCEFNKGPLPTRLDDLLGFWEMIEYQVEDVIKKFQTLEQTAIEP